MKMLKFGDIVTFNSGALSAGIFLGIKCKESFLVNYYSSSFDKFRQRVYYDLDILVIKLPVRMTGLTYLEEIEYNYVKEVLKKFLQEGMPYLEVIEVDSIAMKLGIRNVNTELVKAALVNDKIKGLVCSQGTKLIDDTELLKKWKYLKKCVDTVKIEIEPVKQFKENRFYVGVKGRQKVALLLYNCDTFYNIHNYTQIDDTLYADIYDFSRFSLKLLLNGKIREAIIDDYLYYETNVVIKC